MSKKNSNYLSIKESRKIISYNIKQMKYYESLKKKKMDVSEYTSVMNDENNIIEIDNLQTHFFTDNGTVKSVNGVSFNIPKNKIIGVVGESGCGKSVTSMSVMRLLQGPTGQIASGSIRFKSLDFKRDEEGKPIPIYVRTKSGKVIYKKKKDKRGHFVMDREGNPVLVPLQAVNESGVLSYEMEEKVFDIAKMPIQEVHKIRGRQIAMIFQEPMTSLNPVFTIGDQLDEVTFIHTPGATKEMAKAHSLEMLKLVGIDKSDRVYNSYPHELSGGMRQRVMIAMALACDPRLIIADEPTTALDVTIQAQILDLLRDLKTRMNGSIMLITHDLGIIAEMADYVVVMYAGRVIEQGTVQEIFHDPKHPYTMGLQKSKPSMETKSDTLFNIPGNVPNPVNMPTHCYFKDRCDKCIGKCSGDYPCMKQVSPTHYVACHLYEEEK